MEILPNSYAQQPEPNAAYQTVQRTCGLCHSLEVMGKCLAGDCSKPRTVHVTKPLQWDKVLDRMKGKGANLSENERQVILAYLDETYPPKHYPLVWNKVGDFTGQEGWNVTSLREHRGFLYAGFEGNGKIFRSADGSNWQEIAKTGHYTVYGITPFKGKLYAGVAEHDPQIWRSSDGLNWQPGVTLPIEDLGVYCIGVFKNQLYAGTGRSRIYRSSDGKKWEQVAKLRGDVQPMFENWMRFLIPFKGMLYAGVEQGPLYRSADGIIWTKANLDIGDKNGFRGATVFKGALYVGTTSDGTIWRSKNGQEWHRVFKSPNDTPGYVAAMAVAGDYIFTTIGGYVFRSTDGLIWEEAGHLGSTSLESATGWRGNIYVGISNAPAGFIYRADTVQK